MATTKIIALVALAVIHTASANHNITSPQVTNWGPWGRMERCPFGRYAQGFQLRTEPYQGLFDDDSALNTIRLFCGDPFRSDTAVIYGSPVGLWGDWGTIYTCFPGFLNGFQFRSESDRGSGDDTAANNIRFYCSSFNNPNDYIQGDGMDFGDWTQAQRCNSDQGICAMQTQIEPSQGQGDDSSLNNVRFECCDRNLTPQQAAVAAAAHPQEKVTTVGDLNIFEAPRVIDANQYVKEMAMSKVHISRRPHQEAAIN